MRSLYFAVRSISVLPCTGPDHFFLARFQDYSIRLRRHHVSKWCVNAADSIVVAFPFMRAGLPREEHRPPREWEKPMALDNHDSSDVSSDRDPYDATPFVFPTSCAKKVRIYSLGLNEIINLVEPLLIYTSSNAE
jgi:hypothetical protein